VWEKIWMALIAQAIELAVLAWLVGLHLWELAGRRPVVGDPEK
jgi:hypothetical protein